WLSDELLLLTESGGWTRYLEWQPRTGEEDGLGSSATQPELGAYAPDKHYHASFAGRPPRSVAIRDWRTGETVATVYLGSDVQDMAFSPDGRWLVVRGVEGLVKVWPIVGE
ncbi:MAG: WD40 repeat domain-containing protein, partial [Anaerolineae bacterium]|nr:WD40 repeat domain-containing protein [Anaerolineae bacterium]